MKTITIQVDDEYYDTVHHEIDNFLGQGSIEVESESGVMTLLPNRESTDDVFKLEAIPQGKPGETFCMRGYLNMQHVWCRVYADVGKEIKDGDWVIETKNNDVLSQFSEMSLNQKSMGCLKVIESNHSLLGLPNVSTPMEKVPVLQDRNFGTKY